MLIIGNGTLVTLGKKCRVIEGGGVLIENGLIAAVGDTAGLLKTAPGAEYFDCRGKLIMPGFICVHTHTYGTFTRGMALSGEAPADFPQVLERLWWRFDRALSLEDIYYSALITFIACLKNGTTTVLDHHASPNAISASLEQIGRAARETGIRANLCYEVSDRDGAAKMQAGLEENVSFIRQCREVGSAELTATFGMHASFTIGPETMENCARAAHDQDTGIHIHVAESREDAIHCREKYGIGVVERLDRYNLLGPKTLAAHCVHISEEEMVLLARSGTNVAHNPQSNMNNAVGCAPVLRMLDKGVKLGLGSDGMTTDMIEGMKTAHILHKHCQEDPRVGWAEVPLMQFGNNPQIMGGYFPVKLGELAPGTAADLIVVDYDPPTPLTAENYYGHLVFGMTGRMVETTLVAGKILMRNRSLTTINEENINSLARELAAKLWKRL